MANVSSSNSLEKYPKLRFPSFTEPWAQINLGDIATEVRRVNPESNAPIMMLSAGNGFIMQSEKYSRDNAGQSLKKYILLRKGELAYNHGASKSKQYGCCYELLENEARIPYVYHCFAVKNTVHTPFIAELLNNSKLDRQLKRLVSSSVRMDGLLNISFEDYMSVNLAIPEYSEQKQIADFLKLLENKIILQKQLVDLLKKYKRGVTNAILNRKLTLSKNEWKYVPISKIGCFFGGLSGKSKKDFNHGNNFFITYMNVYKNPFANIDGIMKVDISSNEHQNKIQYGDIIFTQSSETLEEVGMSSVWLHNTSPYLNSFCMALRPNNINLYNPIFLGYALRSDMVRRQIMKEGQGISRINLAASRLENVIVPIPPIDEQNHISTILKSIDAHFIDAQKELELLIHFKKALIQQMFI